MSKEFGNIFEIGSCNRKLGYRYLNYEAQPYTYPTWKGFQMSRLAESFVKETLVQKGYKIIGKNKDVQFEGFTGRIDGLVIRNNEPVLLECKMVINEEKYELVKSHGLKSGNKFHYAQIQTYLASPSLNKLRNCLVVVLDNNESTWDDACWHEEMIAIDFEFQQYLKNKISKLKEAVYDGNLPFPDPSVETNECAYCIYRNLCKYQDGRIIVPCHKCSVKNKLQIARLNRRAKCGNCGAYLN